MDRRKFLSLLGLTPVAAAGALAGGPPPECMADEAFREGRIIPGPARWVKGKAGWMPVWDEPLR